MSKYKDAAAESPFIQPIMERGKLCCPFCDEWRLSDSYAARKKLGAHLANQHADEVLFPAGTEPPELEDI